MRLNTGFVLAGVATVLALPHAEEPGRASPPNEYTLTAYAPGNTELNGLRAELSGDLWLYQKRVISYCPLPSGCPNGNHTAFGAGMYPGSEVPGGQSCYVTAAGEFQVTVQHSHEIPPDAYAAPTGWSYTPLKDDAKTGLEHCPKNSKMYRCSKPTGYYTFKAPEASEGGLVACPKKFGHRNAAAIYAVTPKFNQTGCTPLEGLGTHNFTGEYPPVWSYY